MSIYPIGSQVIILSNYYPRIRDLREDAELTQRELSEKMKISQAQYWRYERGYRDIPTDLLIFLANLYNTSTDYLLGRTNDLRPPTDWHK